MDSREASEIPKSHSPSFLSRNIYSIFTTIRKEILQQLECRRYIPPAGTLGSRRKGLKTQLPVPFISVTTITSRMCLCNHIQTLSQPGSTEEKKYLVYFTRRRRYPHQSKKCMIIFKYTYYMLPFPSYFSQMYSGRIFSLSCATPPCNLLSLRTFLVVTILIMLQQILTSLKVSAELF